MMAATLIEISSKLGPCAVSGVMAARMATLAFKATITSFQCAVLLPSVNGTNASADEQ